MNSKCFNKQQLGVRVGFGLPLSLSWWGVSQVHERVGAETLPKSKIDGRL